jgi:D-alanine-D-alanine ligase-like ATP-grasp enzyme
VTAGSRRRPPAAATLIEAVADQVDVARYEDPPSMGHHRELLRRAAEARGIETVEHPGGFIGLDGDRAVIGTGGMGGTFAPSTSYLAISICKSKRTTLRLLRMADLPVPEGRSFDSSASDQAIDYARRLGWPVVLKPSGGRGGSGVSVGIRSDQDFRAAWGYAESTAEGSDAPMIVEREHDAVDVRVYVVAGRAVAGCVRLPAYVRGDGRSSVETLVEKANQERLAHPYLSRMPIELDVETDRQLQTQELGRDSVPEERRIVLLRRSGNITTGGVSVDVTDRLPAALVDVALRAVGAIPGLDAAGVDFLVPDVDSANGAVILELNAAANICIAHFPVAGEPRDVAGALVERSLSLYS